MGEIPSGSANATYTVLATKFGSVMTLCIASIIVQPPPVIAANRANPHSLIFAVVSNMSPLLSEYMFRAYVLVEVLSRTPYELQRTDTRVLNSSQRDYFPTTCLATVSLLANDAPHPLT